MTDATTQQSNEGQNNLDRLKEDATKTHEEQAARDKQKREQTLRENVTAFIGDVGLKIEFDLTNLDDIKLEARCPITWDTLTDDEQATLSEIHNPVRLAAMYNDLDSTARAVVDRIYDLNDVVIDFRQKLLFDIVDEYRELQNVWNEEHKTSFTKSKDRTRLVVSFAALYVTASTESERTHYTYIVNEFLTVSGMNKGEWEKLIKEGYRQQKRERKKEQQSAGPEQNQSRSYSDPEFVHGGQPGNLPIVSIHTPDGLGGVMPKKDNEIADEIVTHLKGDEVRAYRHGRNLMVIQPAGDNHLITELVTEKTMKTVINRSCTVTKLVPAIIDGKEKYKVVTVPSASKDICNDILFAPRKLDVFAELKFVTPSPYVHDGKVHYEAGYNADSKIYTNGLALCDLKRSGSVEEAIAILMHYLGEVPFKTDADVENALSLMLTPIIRPMLPTDMPPLFCVEAASEGSGKTYLAQMLLAPTFGFKAQTTSAPSGETDFKKVLFSLVHSSSLFVIFDNLSGDRILNSPSLAEHITSQRKTDRLLFTQSMGVFDNWGITICTGNNTMFSNELIDRSVSVELISPANKNAMEDFTRDPLKHVITDTAYRSEVLGALVTIVENWIQQGMPENPNARHRHRGWSRTVGGVLMSVGLGDNFLRNDKSVRERKMTDWGAFDSALNEIIMKLGIKKVYSERECFISANDTVFNICSFDPEEDDDDKSMNLLGGIIEERWGKDKPAKQTAKRRVTELLQKASGRTFANGKCLHHKGSHRGKHYFWIENKATPEQWKNLVTWLIQEGYRYDDIPDEDVPDDLKELYNEQKVKNYSETANSTDTADDVLL